ncbi:MAG: tyrosine-type recombinase/integrase [Caldilineaceae bacterium]
MEQPSLFATTRLGKLVVQPQLAIKPPTPQATVLETLPAYYTYLKSGDYSAYTVDDFTGDIKKLGMYLPKKAVATISLNDLRQWLRYLASPTGEQLQAKTVSRKVAAVKNYFQWLKNSRVLQADPTAWLLTQRITSPLPNVLYEAECQQLLAAASTDPRTYFLILLLLETGLKKEELFTLRVEHFDFSDKYKPLVWIQHEGKKVAKNRKLQLPANIIPVFDEYRRIYNIAGALFPYTPRLIEYILTTMGAHAGITKKVTAQILRDTCAVRLLKQGIPIETVLKKLGLNPSTWEDAKEKYLKLTAPPL